MACGEIPYAAEQGIFVQEQGILDCTRRGEQGLGCWIDSLAGVLNLKLDRAPISERGVEPAFVVDLVDEVRKRVDDVGERLIAAEVDFLGLDSLHEALGLGVVIGDAAAAHRTAQPMLCERLAILIRGVLCSTIGMVHTSGGGLTVLNC